MPRSLTTHLYAARRSAVQALYCLELAAPPMAEMLALFSPEPGNPLLASRARLKTDKGFNHFRHLLEAVSAQTKAIDERLAQHLDKGWPLARLDHVMRALLRAAVAELAFSPQQKKGTGGAVEDYVRIARDFLNPEQAGMVHAVLDAVRQGRGG